MNEHAESLTTGDYFGLIFVPSRLFGSFNSVAKTDDSLEKDYALEEFLELREHVRFLKVLSEELEHQTFGPLPDRWPDTATHHGLCGQSEVAMLTFLDCVAIQTHALTHTHFYHEEDWHHFLPVSHDESLSVENLERALHMVVECHHHQPLLHLLGPFYFLHFFLDHLLFAHLEDFPLVKLENAILLIELLLFLLVDIGNFGKYVSAVFAQFSVHLLFGFVEASDVDVFPFAVFLRTLLFHVVTQYFVVFLF